MAAKEAAGGVDGARLERWTVRKFGALGLAHVGLELSPGPRCDGDGALGLSWSPDPS